MWLPNKIAKLPANNLGKDYVIGDLHGCFELLQRLLASVHFDPQQDRLFSVGDLIDRGPDSLRCLQLIAEPWFYGVLGNHEMMMINFFLSYLQNGVIQNLYDTDESGFLESGGEWINAYFDIEQHIMLPEFTNALQSLLSLPLLLVVAEDKRRFHVIHAQLTKIKSEKTIPSVYVDKDIDRWLVYGKIPKCAVNSLLWGRSLTLMKHLLATKQTGLSTTFCGHTYAHKPRKVLSHLCLDTGAFITTHVDPEFNRLDYGLTLFDVQESCCHSTSATSHSIISQKMPRAMM